MKSFRYSLALLVSALATISIPVQESHAQSIPIMVWDVEPFGDVVINQNYLVSAKVAVTGLPDGSYDVTVYVTNYSTYVTVDTEGTVNISGGTGIVEILADFPTADYFDMGDVYVKVHHPSGGQDGINFGELIWVY